MPQEYKIISQDTNTNNGVTEIASAMFSTSAATVNFAGISASTMSATTFYGNGANLSGIGSSTFSGGTVNGNTTFTSGLTASTIYGTSVMVIPRLASAPVSPTDGQVYYDTTLTRFFYWNSTVNSWIGYIGELGSWKQPVRVASIATITIATPGTSIDGVTLVNGDRVLLKNQTAGAENGIYVFAGSATTMTRATDGNSSFKLTNMITVPVQEGTVNAGSRWQLNTIGTITLGTTSLDFGLLNFELLKVRPSAPPNPVAGRVYFNTADGEVYIHDGVSWNQLSTNIISSATTTNASATTATTISVIPNNEVSIVRFVVKGFKSDGTIYGVYERNVAVSKFSNVLTVLQTTAEFDKMSGGLTTQSVSFSSTGGNLNLIITGIAAQTISWITKYQII